MKNYAWATQMDTKFLSDKKLFNIATKLRLFGAAMANKENNMQRLIDMYVNFIDKEEDVPFNIFQELPSSSNAGAAAAASSSLDEQHDEELVTPSARICKKFLQGTCTRGSDCKFVHKKPMCKFFGTPRGCRYGNSCHYEHVKPSGRKRSKIAQQEERLQKKRKADADNFYGATVPVDV